MGLMERLFARTGKIAWGVHPDERKRPVADLPLARLPLPRRLFLPLQQHIGSAARPVVQVGQQVAKGQLLAAAHGEFSAPLHAPTSGRVAAIEDITAPHPSGLPCPAIVLEADGEDRWGERLPTCDDPFKLSPGEIARRVADAGIVGLGGASFPSAVKLALSQRSAVATLIINGGECEPYLSCDDRLMRDFADEVVDGVRIVLYAVGASRALVGIEDNKPEALAAMREAAKPFASIEIHAVPARYPMGSEKQLIQTLTGKEVPAKGRPADVGVLVHNVGTARAVHRALRHGEPLIERIVTVNGGALERRGNLLVPIGALVEDLLAFCKLAFAPQRSLARLVMGGPMMGSLLPHARVPVVKGTSGVLALTADELPAITPGPCIRCGYCSKVCPMGLLPLEIAARVHAGELTAAETCGLTDCMGCGCCAYVCTAHIPLTQYFQHAKGELAAQQRIKLRQQHGKRLATARAERLAREAKEKAAIAAARKAARNAAKAAAAAQAVASEEASA